LALLGLLMFGTALIPFAHAQPSVTATVNVGLYQPYGVAYDPANGDVYVANFGDGIVSVISDSTNTVIANVSVPGTPADVAYDSAKGEIFVSTLWQPW